MQGAAFERAYHRCLDLLHHELFRQGLRRVKQSIEECVGSAAIPDPAVQDLPIVVAGLVDDDAITAPGMRNGHTVEDTCRGHQVQTIHRHAAYRGDPVRGCPRARQIRSTSPIARLPLLT